MKSETTKRRERNLRNLKAQYKRSQGYGATRTSALCIQEALADRIADATASLATSRENDRIYGI